MTDGRGGFMDERDALVNSLGEQCVAYIGRDALRQLTVTVDLENTLAHVEICLLDDSWAAREQAIDRMIDVRRIFLDELSIDYAFADAASCIDASERTPAEFVLV